MRIAVGAWGSSIRFKNRDERWSGQSEYILFIEYLLGLDEVDEVVLLGRNDGGWGSYPKEWRRKIIQQDCDRKMGLFTKDRYPRADFAYIFMTQGASCISTIPGYRWVPPRGDQPYRRTKVLAMAENYAAPITDYLNITKIPWAYLATDVRYIDMIKPADLTNHPKYVLSCLEGKIPKWTHAVKYLPYKDSRNLEYHEYRDIPVTYAKLQKLNLFASTETTGKRVKTTRFALVCNRIQTFPYRALEVAKYAPKGCDLYGNLEVSGFNNQFVSAADLDVIFSRVKYTLTIPIYGHGHGKKWLTFKPYEMIRCGVIPFCHPDYDVDGRFVNETNKHYAFLRVTSPKDLREKMDYLDANDKYRLELLHELEKKLVPPTDLINYAKG
jgi:hypothetical protein